MNPVRDSGKHESRPEQGEALNGTTRVRCDPGSPVQAAKKTEFELCVEQATGKTIEYLRDTPIDEQRCEVEAKRGKKVRFKSYFPLIGRGSVLHGRLVSHDDAEAAYRASVEHG